MSSDVNMICPAIGVFEHKTVFHSGKDLFFSHSISLMFPIHTLFSHSITIISSKVRAKLGKIYFLDVLIVFKISNNLFEYNDLVKH